MTLASRVLSVLFGALLCAVFLSGASSATVQGYLPSSGTAGEWVVDDDASRSVSRSSDPSYDGDWAFDEDAGLAGTLHIAAAVRAEGIGGATSRVSLPCAGTCIRGPPSLFAFTTLHTARFDTVAPSVPPATCGSTGTSCCSDRPALCAGPAAPLSLAARPGLARPSPERTADTTPLPYGVVSAVALVRVETSAALTSGGRGSP